jgi:uncharacterized Ntn-hydrolase superfamily protein
MIHPSTFSIVACDLNEQAWGIAVASKFPAVGAVVPWAKAGVGAVATQSHANTAFGPAGLDLMQSGISAEDALKKLLADDPDREHRQVGIVDAQGRSATFTGSECYAWAGGVTGPGFAAQGNILAGDEISPAMVAGFHRRSPGDLADHLFRALLAGDRAGGDRRGRQSAAILVVKPKGGYAGFNDRWIDYRIDDHPDPVPALGELLEMHRLYFGESPEQDKVRLQGHELERFQKMMEKIGYYQGEFNGNYDAATRNAFERFINTEHFEDRVIVEQGLIDRPVLYYLYRRFEETI